MRRRGWGSRRPRSTVTTERLFDVQPTLARADRTCWRCSWGEAVPKLDHHRCTHDDGAGYVEAPNSQARECPHWLWIREGDDE